MNTNTLLQMLPVILKQEATTNIFGKTSKTQQCMVAEVCQAIFVLSLRAYKKYYSFIMEITTSAISSALGLLK